MANSALLGPSVAFMGDQLSLPSPSSMVYLGPPVVVCLEDAFMKAFEKVAWLTVTARCICFLTLWQSEIICMTYLPLCPRESFPRNVQTWERRAWNLWATLSMSVITQINLSLVFPPVGAGSISVGRLIQCSVISSGQFCRLEIVLHFLPGKEMCSAIVIRRMAKRSIQRD